VRSPTLKIDADEKELLESVERGEWKSAAGGKRERTRYARYAKATFRKDRRLNIRLSSKDVEAIQSGRSRRACRIRRSFPACCTSTRRDASRRCRPHGAILRRDRVPLAARC